MVHNVLSSTSTDPNTVIPAGIVSIYNVNSMNIFSTAGRPTLVTSLPKVTTGRPFGPATVVTDNNNKDYVFVAENTFEYSGELDVDSLYVISTNDDNTTTDTISICQCNDGYRKLESLDASIYKCTESFVSIQPKEWHSL